MSDSKLKTRVFARTVARELTFEECKKVAGAEGDTGAGCNWNTGRSYDVTQCTQSYDGVAVYLDDDQQITDWDA